MSDEEVGDEAGEDEDGLILDIDTRALAEDFDSVGLRLESMGGSPSGHVQVVVGIRGSAWAYARDPDRDSNRSAVAEMESGETSAEWQSMVDELDEDDPPHV